jgi:hypothetical protein
VTDFAFSVVDGAWTEFGNIVSDDQAEMILQNQIDKVNERGCLSADVVRVP